jgi:hypothetical protein
MANTGKGYLQVSSLQVPDLMLPGDTGCAPSAPWWFPSLFLGTTVDS